MQNLGIFDLAVKRISQRDTRFHPNAFYLLREALDDTIKNNSNPKSPDKARHVTGKQLALGFRDYVINEFGPMSSTILKEWGVNSCADIGAIVFLLIGEEVFAKQETDSPEDFANHYDFHDEFIRPYLPEKQLKSEKNNP